MRQMEIKLREAIARYEAVLASTLDPVFVIDALGIVQTASNSVERIFGWSPAELVGRNVSMLMPEPMRSQHDVYLERYRRTGVTHILGRTREFDAVRKDGSRFPIELSVSRVDVPGQEQPLFTGIIHDISERRQSEQELLLVQGLALDIARASDVRAAMGTVLDRICEFTGWEFGEAWTIDSAKGRTARDPIWRACAEGLEPMVEAAAQLEFRPNEGLPGRVWAALEPDWVDDLGDPKQFCRGQAAAKCGLRAGGAIPIVAGDGCAAIVAFYTRQQRAEDRRLLEVVRSGLAPLGSAILRKQAEDALFESERRMRDMLERIQIIGVTLDRNARIRFCNEFLLRTTGWRRDEILGKTWFDLFIPEDQQGSVRTVFDQEIRHGNVTPHFENEILTRSGERRSIAWNNTVVLDSDSGDVVGITALGIDVTERRRAEAEVAQHRDRLQELVAERTKSLEETHERLRQSDRLASIGTLAAGLGHDMNNVLLPVRCRLDVLDVMNLDGPARENLAAVRKSVDYLQRLADGLHLLALDPEDEHASTEAVDIEEWWDQVGPLLGRTLPKHVRLATAWSTDLPAMAVPPHRLTQAALNLLVNAGEAVGEDGRVRVWAEHDPDRNVVRLGVTDNGSGMSDEVMRHALDPFFTTKKRGLGTGLGLSLVHGVVRSAGGTVEIESQVGHGTTIVLHLPVATDPAVSAGEESRLREEALVAVSDSRARGAIVSLLRGDGVEPRSELDASSTAYALAVVDPTPENLQVVDGLRSAGRDRLAVILTGPGGAEWRRLAPIVIRNCADLDAIRTALSKGIKEIRDAEATDPHPVR